METITTYAILCIEFVRNGIHVSIVRHSLVESCIEYTYLRYIRKDSSYRVDTLQVSRVVKRSEVATCDECIEHFLVNQYGLGELFTTMYHTVTYGIDFVQ